MKGRVVLFALLVLAWMGGLAYRLYSVQITEHERYLARAQEQQYKEVKLTPPRGAIFDREGRRLAASVEVDSVFAQLPTDGADVTIDAIARVLGDLTELRPKLEAGKWTWLARHVEPSVADELRALQLEGVDFVKESKRSYPLGRLAGPVLGFVGTDHTGLAGLEAAYDSVVAGKRAQRTMLRDALRGQAVAPGMAFLDAEPGDDLWLTIDAGVQYIVERELARAVDEHSATSASAVLMDPENGAILAMASLPSFDPNSFADAPQQNWRNRVIQDAYEPGSTMKMVTAVAALEANVLDPLDVFDCEMGAITLGSTRIRDHKPFGLLTFRDVIARSSNVGAIKAGLRVGAEPLARQIEAFGFGQPTGIDLPGESRGIVRPVERWSKYAVAYASMGHGLSVTPMQLARAFAAVANGGLLVQPYVVDRISGRPVERQPAVRQSLLSKATNRTLLRLLEAVVEDGTGQAAAIEGYSVAGKTGTAQKVVGGGYSADVHVASFAGFVPSRAPRVVGVVVVDEPRGKFHGGEVAAPVFSAILRQALPLLGVPPDVPIATDAPAAAVIAAATPTEGVPGKRAASGEIDRMASVEDGRLPDFAGLSARQALRLANTVGIEVQLEGSGFVRHQQPSAGTRLEAVDDVVLELVAGRRG